MSADDRAVVTVVVEVPPATAFEVFTRETDLWWRRSPRFRMGSTITFEPRAGGRLLDGAREIGTISVWDPPARLIFSWRNANFAPGESTEVEVRFEPTRRGTRVTVEHRGWSKIRADHPARHGHAPGPFLAELGGWWGDLMTALRRYAG